MPIYEYRCESCGHELEAMQKFSEAALTDCPSCAKPTLKKLVSAAGFQLKGSGWYATDFKGGTKKTENGEKSEKTEKGEKAGKTEKGEKAEGGSSSSEPKKHGCGAGSCGCH
jgi:putative FmdB family regulatory protein